MKDYGGRDGEMIQKQRQGNRKRVCQRISKSNANKAKVRRHAVTVYFANETESNKLTEVIKWRAR